MIKGDLLSGALSAPTRRSLLTMIGKIGGAAAMYQAMTTLGHAAETRFTGPPGLSGARPGSSVLVLGAGLAGLLAAYELARAGYAVQVLEYQDRAGGRNYSVRGGDRIAEIGGATQTAGFAPGNYLNPGPWRIPHHHRTLLHYCKTLGVERACRALHDFLPVGYRLGSRIDPAQLEAGHLLP